MMPIIDLLNKIKHDKRENSDDYTIVYLDRILNKGIEIRFSSIQSWSKSFMLVSSLSGQVDIPLHRIKQVKKNGTIVWKREEISVAKDEPLSIEKVSKLLGLEKKNIQQFRETTPKGNKIEGWIVKERNERMGSLLVEKVNGKQTLQYVSGMPKIHYNDEVQFDLNVFENIRLLEKLDGTNVVFFPLIVDGKVIEVCTKTRLMPLSLPKWGEIIGEMIKKYPQIIDAVEKEKVSIATEMFGYRNAHGVDYSVLEISLEVNVHTILDKGMALPSWQVEEIVGRYNLPFDSDIRSKEFKERYKEFITEVEWPEDYNSLYPFLEGYFEDMNKKYKEKYPDSINILVEGCVWHMDKNGETFMLKNKATMVKETHIAIACGIDPIIIDQAIRKVFENSTRENFSDNEKAINLIKEELEENFQREIIEDIKTSQRIDKLYSEFLEFQNKADRYRSIAGLIDEKAGKEMDVSEKLRMFAKLYPDLKKESGLMFRIFSKQV